ncbi:MAG: UTP--glucose-1-phosphate uridylyltransferase GalU [Xanthomonadales bacterium]|nr:UTP--glucose-1-phosphate uridylyltransferase GalU [Gammaproteobacteria bacterium]NND56284.1 UTP--glucose-1-phosphate uridylyltransferase GalU [Xanthomonadales bacterium]
MGQSKPVRKAVFPVAGLGTRFLPATKSIPKEMLPIVDKPLIQYAVEEALDAGIDTLIFVTSRNKHAISDHFDTAFELQTRLAEDGKTELLKRITQIVPDEVNLVYVTQPEALGLGHAILCAETIVGDEPFAILLADDMIRNRGAGALEQMIELHRESGSSVIGVEEIPDELTTSYGIVGVQVNEQRQNAIHTIVEKPKPEDAPSRLGVVGRYILDSSVFSCLRRVTAGSGGEIQLTDGIAAMLQTQPVLAFPFDGERYDCGSRHGFIKATIDYALEHDELREDMLDHMHRLLKTSGRI